MATTNNNPDNKLADNPYVRRLSRPESPRTLNQSEDTGGAPKQEEPSPKRKLSRRQAILGVVGLGAAIGVPALLVTRPWETPIQTQSDAPLTFDVTEEDKKAITDFMNAFMKSAANFGVDTEQVTPSTIRNIRYLVKTKNPGYNKYLRTRTDAYRSVRSGIWEGSPLFYNADTVGRWNRESYLEDERMPTFELKENPRVYPDPSGTYYIDANGTNHRRVTVQVDFTTKETVRVQMADGAGSNGAFAVLVKEIPSTIKMDLIESNNRWYLYSQTGSDQYLLATWAEFNSSQYAEAQNSGFTKVAEIIPTDAPATPPASSTPTPSATP